jgi:hypothetical protein
MTTWRKGLGQASDPTVQQFASAIAQMEGFGTPGVWATINNNPGNLRTGPGQTGTNGGFAVFPTVDAGYAALDQQIDTNIALGLNLQQFFAGEPGVYPGYAPAADSNNPTNYANFVAGQLGISTTTPLTQVIDTTSTDSSSTPSNLASDLSTDDSGDDSDTSDDPLSALSIGGLPGAVTLGIGLAFFGLVWAFSR